MPIKKLNIALLRAKKEWSQEYVSKRIGITKQAYSNIETGKRKPSYKVIVLLQKLFNQSIDYLLSDDTNQLEHNTEQKSNQERE